MKKILIVDALPSSLSRHESLLARDDVQVFGSTSPDAAIALHRKERADLVILDLDLPGGSAESFCRRIRSDPELKRVSVIVLCRNSEADLKRASQCRANLCLTRPVRGGPLRLAAERLLDVPDRRSYRVLVRVEGGEAPSMRAFFCTSGNLSTAGLLIETDTALAKGDVVTCSFFLPDRARIVAQAEVVRVAPKPDGKFQYGLHFLHLAPGERALMKAFVDARPGRG
jgi:DNA-binding response OmpR family regulator